MSSVFENEKNRTNMHEVYEQDQKNIFFFFFFLCRTMESKCQAPLQLFQPALSFVTALQLLQDVNIAECSQYPRLRQFITEMLAILELNKRLLKAESLSEDMATQCFARSLCYDISSWLYLLTVQKFSSVPFQLSMLAFRSQVTLAWLKMNFTGVDVEFLAWENGQRQIRETNARLDIYQRVGDAKTCGLSDELILHIISFVVGDQKNGNEA
jgi:hypothetical protein